MYRVTKKDRKRNTFICEQLGIASIDDKMRETCLRWYKHVPIRPPGTMVKRGEMINVSGIRWGRGMLKKTLLETINKDFKYFEPN